MKKSKFNFKVGDKFVYNIKLMMENGYSPDQYDNRVHEVCSVEYHDGLGEIVGWWSSSNKILPSQCNADWLIKIPDKKVNK